MSIIIGYTSIGLPYEPVEVKPTTASVKWYQFWRWHKIKEVNKLRATECINQLELLFGKIQEPDKVMKQLSFFIDNNIAVAIRNTSK